MANNTEKDILNTLDSQLSKGYSRRNFLQLAGGVAGAGLLLASCRRTPPDSYFVGVGDAGLLNYLYMFETVMAAFYTRSYEQGPAYYSMTLSELELLADLRDHQLIHKEFLKQILGRDVMGEILPDLSAITFADRTNTLTHAIALEDMLTGAYAGALTRFTDTTYVAPISKIMTVQARHAAYVRDILTANSFADSVVVDSNGFGQALSPQEVMATLKTYIATHLDYSKVPA